MSVSADLAGLALTAFRNQKVILIAYGLTFGLSPKEFVGPLWRTGNIGEAWAGWLAHGVPEIPANLVILAAIFAITIAWEVGKRSQEGGYSHRDDGYRAGRDD
jgi:hypothetical protein